MGAVSHKEDRTCQAQQTEQLLYAGTAITAIETTLAGASLYKYRDRESCDRGAELCLKMLCGMPSSALGSWGIEGLGEALRGPPGLTLLARHNFHCATNVISRRMPLMVCEVALMSLSCDG